MQFNQNVTDSDLANMFGGMLARSMRIAKGDSDGHNVRMALPSFQDRYNLYRQRDIDRYGSLEDAAGQDPYARTSQDSAERLRRLEQNWRTHADTDMRNYDLLQQRMLRNQMTSSPWTNY